MEKDYELERIRRKKLEKLLKRQRISTPEAPIKITDSEFDRILNKYPLLLIDFWAPWCFPCKMIAPVLEELAREYKGKLVIGKINVDENPIISARFQIFSIPTLILFKNGRPVERIVGALPKEYLEEKIRVYL
ncbi:MAG: thioredoxin [Candidatus Hydrothermarchaeota archaeon]|nr:MAG: thioredoxin [Candidatus Hydrothermarchaeota archaeon]